MNINDDTNPFDAYVYGLKKGREEVKQSVRIAKERIMHEIRNGFDKMDITSRQDLYEYIEEVLGRLEK